MQADIKAIHGAAEKMEGYHETRRGEQIVQEVSEGPPHGLAEEVDYNVGCAQQGEGEEPHG